MRIAGITLPEKKRLEIALQSLYGIGRSRALSVLLASKVDSGKMADKLSSEEEARIRRELEQFKIEGELKRDISSHIKRLKDIKSYRGIRHMRGLPVRGQRTKTNSRTRRGNVRKTMGSGKRKAEKK